MGCKVSKTIVMGPTHAKNLVKQAMSSNSLESASFATSTLSSGPSTSLLSTSTSSTPKEGLELSSLSNLVVSCEKIQGDNVETNDVSEPALVCERLEESSSTQIVIDTSSYLDEITVARNGHWTTNDNNVMLRKASSQAGVSSLSTRSYCDSSNKCAYGNVGMHTNIHVQSCNQVANNSTQPWKVAPSSPKTNNKPTPVPTTTTSEHITEKMLSTEGCEYMPTSIPLECGTKMPSSSKPLLTRSKGQSHAKTFKITAITVVQQPGTSDSAYRSVVASNGVTVQSVEDGRIEQLRSSDPLTGHLMQCRNYYTSPLDHAPSFHNGGCVKVTNSHTIDNVHGFLTNHVYLPQGPLDKQSMPNQACVGIELGAIEQPNTDPKVSPHITNIMENAPQYVVNSASQKVATLPPAIGSASSTPQAKALVPPSPFPYGGLGGLIDPVDCSTLPSLESRRKLPPIQTTLSKASQLKLSTQTIDPFIKPSLAQQQACTSNRDSILTRSSSPLLFQEVQVESSDSSPSSTSSIPDICSVSVRSRLSSSSSSCSFDTMIGSSFKETLEKADMNTSGWTSIEEFLSARKSPNAILLDFERESVIREDALDKPLEQQEDHALAFETSTTRRWSHADK